MSIWMSVGIAEPWIVFDRWADGETDEDHKAYVDVASSVASPCVRLVVDRDYELHIADKVPFDHVLLSPSDARELARRLAVAADRTDAA